jgi:hypothetical protein
MNAAPTPEPTLRPASEAHYRRALGRLAGEVKDASADLQPVLDGFARFAAEGGEAPRPRQTLLVEALSLGVLWRSHGAEALRARPLVTRLAAAFRRAAGRGPTLAPESRPPTLPEVGAVLTWLASTGERAEQVARLEAWERFLAADPVSAPDALAAVVEFAAWFEARSLALLGRFTEPEPESFRPVRADEFWGRALRWGERHLEMVAHRLADAPPLLSE